jgi:hypothetical protein
MPAQMTTEQWRNRQALAKRRGDTPEAFLIYMCTGIRLRDRKKQAQRADPAFIDHCIELYYAQGGTCAVSGIPLRTDATWRDPYNISIDRMDNKRGYVAGNVRLVTQWANNAMGSWGLDTMLDVMEAMVRHLGVAEPTCETDVDGEAESWW